MDKIATTIPTLLQSNILRATIAGAVAGNLMQPPEYESTRIGNGLLGLLTNTSSQPQPTAGTQRVYPVEETKASQQESISQNVNKRREPITDSSEQSEQTIQQSDDPWQVYQGWINDFINDENTAINSDSDDEFAPMLNNQEIQQQIAIDEQLEPEQIQQINEEIRVERRNLVNDIIEIVNRYEDIGSSVQDRRRFAQYLANQILTGVVTGDVLITGIQKIRDIYNQYTVKRLSTPAITRKHDGVYEGPINKQILLDIISRPTKPQCKRHVYTDEYGQLRTKLVCTDSAGTRVYDNS